eukprot:TRINITY_DN25404_c0_g1_i1.p1 TRINITY_DN25404_c0_g1~~TRINITY_DN25404_c0_g1_i1.p1  ORF type:complete len:206 (+),score=90.86 TRINITY_DN25404_c0_g1_i1:44-661(+)
MLAVLAAAVMVLVTTGDDMLWLIPIMAQHNKVEVGVTFVATLQAAVWLSWLVAVLMRGFITAGGMAATGHVVEEVAVGLCWILALALLGNEVSKKRKHHDYADLEEGPQKAPPPPPTSSSSLIFTVVTTTLIGAIDEFLYFPLLIMAHTFSIYELAVGTLLASILILIFVTYLTSYTRIAELFDEIKLYQIVLFFAVYMTIDLIW